MQYLNRLLGVGLCLLGSLTMPQAQNLTQQAHSQDGINLECVAAPTLTQMDQMDRNAEARRSHIMSDKAVVNLPVRHIIIRKSDSSGGVTNAQITNAMTELNSAYAAANVQFYECSRKYVNSDTYYNFDKSEENAMANGNEVANVINIFYVNTATYSGYSVCGYAYFPGGRDRIVMKNSCLTNGSTFIHEFGHYLSLYHTHQSGNELVNGSNCSTAGDRICDTPADPKLNYSNVNSSCTYIGTATDANGDTYAPNPRNVMSYSRKYCRDFFSPQQLARINYSATNDRNYLTCAGNPGPQQYANVNYTTTFNGPTLDQYWSTSSTSSYGRIRVTTSYGPYVGSHHIVMDSRTNRNYVTNRADLHVNCASIIPSTYRLYFRWKEFYDESHNLDGVYLSTNGGQSFVKIYSLTGGASNTWNSVNLNLSQLASSNGLSLTSQTVIRFQQYDNYSATTDGIAIDYVRVTRSTSISSSTFKSFQEDEAEADHQLGPVLSTFDDSKGAINEFLALNSSANQGNLSVFPNPANDVLNVNLNDFERDQKVTIKLVNMLGEVQYSSQHTIQSNGVERLRLQVEQLPAGIYTVVLENEQKVIAHQQVVLNR